MEHFISEIKIIDPTGLLLLGMPLKESLLCVVGPSSNIFRSLSAKFNYFYNQKLGIFSYKLFDSSN